MKSGGVKGWARGAAVGALFAAALIDLAATHEVGHPLWRPVVVLTAGLTAILWPTARRPAWLTPQLRTTVPALLSLAYTASAYVPHHSAPFGPGELTVLLCLLFLAVRHCPPPWSVACAVLDAGALLATPLRYYGALPPGGTPGFTLVGLILIGVVAGLAAYLRSLDYRRTVAVADTRREERLAIAADLHDFVAHHVTGILVQTQVARMMATTRPDDLDPVLAGIERAATEALASMRRTVGVLRDTDAEADRRPVGDLAAITDLTEGFATPTQRMLLDRDPTLPDDLPHEVQAAAFRVVQESLTNVRRHAADATTITVRLRRADGGLEVVIRDDGRGGTQLPAAAHGGGFGLVGLRERVGALGGELRAGPATGSGPGWEVRARFPTAR
ncbi:sensor histidine kinase [Streptomyces sp. NPDC005811]|uniref:sensor histidine kinase n=1 Tax=Streptomyces sp. NPDC005811 TaxID=3154565 RepID=UPI003400B39B